MSGELVLPPTTRCAQCTHPRTFHSRGPCGSRGCKGGADGGPCPAFVAPPDVKLAPAPPPQAAIGEAVATLVAALEHASGRPEAPEAARALKTVTTAIPSIFAATRAHPGRLSERITNACREEPPKREESEVATDAARRPRKRRDKS